MNRDVKSFFDFGRELARNDNAQGLDTAMNTLIGVERQEVVDGWAEGAIERATEAYATGLRAIPLKHRNSAIDETLTLLEQHLAQKG